MPTRSQSRTRVAIKVPRFYQEMRAHDWKTRAQAAKSIGISEGTLSKILSGKVEPSAVTIDRLLTGLDVKYEALFERKEMP